MEREIQSYGTVFDVNDWLDDNRNEGNGNKSPIVVYFIWYRDIDCEKWNNLWLEAFNPFIVCNSQVLELDLYLSNYNIQYLSLHHCLHCHHNDHRQHRTVGSPFCVSPFDHIRRVFLYFANKCIFSLNIIWELLYSTILYSTLLF